MKQSGCPRANGRAAAPHPVGRPLQCPLPRPAPRRGRTRVHNFRHGAETFFNAPRGVSRTEAWGSGLTQLS
jgi:hypothetical protein